MRSGGVVGADVALGVPPMSTHAACKLSYLIMWLLIRSAPEALPDTGALGRPALITQVQAPGHYQRQRTHHLRPRAVLAEPPLATSFLLFVCRDLCQAAAVRESAACIEHALVTGCVSTHATPAAEARHHSTGPSCTLAERRRRFFCFCSNSFPLRRFLLECPCPDTPLVY